MYCTPTGELHVTKVSMYRHLVVNLGLEKADKYYAANEEVCEILSEYKDYSTLDSFGSMARRIRVKTFDRF